MIDNEIVKALECCMGCACTECPYYRDTDIDAENCMGRLIIEALKLVNRQKAEIERLKEAYAVYEETTGLKWARAEAIKEFAERLLDEYDVWTENDATEYQYVCGLVNKIVKEMTEETKHD
jgi:hypothetical protein